MIKTLIIDDEPLAAQLVEEYLEDHPDFELVGVCRDGFEGVKAIQLHQPDLVFLDVQMPRISGFEMLELLDEPPAVIFTTAFDEFALKAFDAHAVDYLLKPFSKGRFGEALQKFSKQESGEALRKLIGENRRVSKESATRIVLKEKGEIVVVPVKEVDYFEANDDFVNIYRKGHKYIKNKTLKYFETVLDAKQYVRVHRSYMVNVSSIIRIENYEKEGYLLKLECGVTIPVSRSGMAKLKPVLGV